MNAGGAFLSLFWRKIENHLVSKIAASWDDLGWDMWENTGGALTTCLPNRYGCLAPQCLYLVMSSESFANTLLIQP